ncbi:rRNA adenine N-6-methyltransferase family protein [Candidatus Phytoplasma pruni]|uniref:Methyltransferase domain-containing protein n=1 Tax=Candidatus Phytoplasma pruni TaxID=479893 RepID=A0A851HIN7_9MOLU|nr:rRNA adenine N-6-methyltransferase family protein [Candidatus Phytoplasma pruni]NWN45693.1 methyltransferase domain-containing protein [Candidatus Phytoplasma pruni]
MNYSSNKNTFKKSVGSKIKKSFLNCSVLILSAVTVVLGIVSSCYNISTQKDFKIVDFFYFSRQSNLLVLMVVIFAFTKAKNKNWYSTASLIALVNILINALVLNHFLEDKSKIYPIKQKHIYYLFYYLEYVIMPILFSIFYLKNINTQLRWKKIWIVFIHPLAYFIIYALANDNAKVLFASPDDQKNLICSFIKIAFVFALLSSAIIFTTTKRFNKYLKRLLFFFVFLVIYFTTYSWYDWKHAKKVVFGPKQEKNEYIYTGAFITPISPNAAKKLSDVVENPDDLRPGDVILELGGGSGNVTQHLIDRYSNKRVKIVVIEKSTYFANVLKKRFEKYPEAEVQIIEGDASEFKLLLSHSTDRIKGIVSTLPLNLLLPEDIVDLNEDLYSIMKNNKIKGKRIKFKEYRFTHMLHRDHEIRGTKAESKIYLVDNLFIPAEINTLYYHSKSSPNPESTGTSTDNQTPNNAPSNDRPWRSWRRRR